MGKPKGGIFRARAFELVYDEGRVRATLDCDEHGPGLRLWNQGNCVAIVAVGDDGAGYVLTAAADGTVLRSLDDPR